MSFLCISHIRIVILHILIVISYTYSLIQHHRISQKALEQANLSKVMDGLNVLGRVPWKINTTIYKVAQQCWDDGIVIGEIPSPHDFELPPQPVRPEGNFTDADYKSDQEEFKLYREALTKYRRIHQKNMVRECCLT